MKQFPEGYAIVYCEGAFGTTNGKTAHGLVRRTRRYKVLSVVDSETAGIDAGSLLNGTSNGIRVFPSIEQAVLSSKAAGTDATHLVVGLAPDGGRLSKAAREDIKSAIRLGLNIDSGLHDYLSEDEEIRGLARKHEVVVRDIRKPPLVKNLHFFSGKIDQVEAFKIAILGTDSAVGKRTTAWVLLDALRDEGFGAEMVGTGQTAWLQGARYCVIMDCLVNDFVSGEIEHAVWSAWDQTGADFVLIEGQGSLLNPAYPGGFEILAAARPDAIILQHAPARAHYDGFPNSPMHPLEVQIQALELVSNRPVVAITINHEDLGKNELASAIRDIRKQTGLPVLDVLKRGAGPLVSALKPLLRVHRESHHAKKVS
jgi:uncharacterized NAD-dependent epimerase/dehydratase family protein